MANKAVDPTPKSDHLKIYKGDVESQINSVWTSWGIHAGTINVGPLGAIDVDKALKETAVSFATAREAARINHQTTHGSTLFYNAATGAIMGQIFDPARAPAVNFRDPFSYLQVAAFATDKAIATSLVAAGRGQNQADAFGSAFSGEVTTWSGRSIENAFPQPRVNATFDKLYHAIFGP